MDTEAVSEADFAACLRDLATVNTLTRARPPTIAWLRRATRGLPRGAEVSVLDEALDLASRLAAAADAGRVDLSDLGRRARRVIASTTQPQLPPDD